MTNELDKIKNDALAAFIPFFDKTRDTDFLDFDAAYILTHLDREPELTANDPANSDSIEYAMTFQLSFAYDGCPLDIIILNPYTYPFYFISIDSTDYQPMI